MTNSFRYWKLIQALTIFESSALSHWKISTGIVYYLYFFMEGWYGSHYYHIHIQSLHTTCMLLWFKCQWSLERANVYRLAEPREATFMRLLGSPHTCCPNDFQAKACVKGELTLCKWLSIYYHFIICSTKWT